MTVVETPVLIIGGGPVGLALAVDLGWRGVSCTLVEQGAPEDRHSYPRMDNVGIRTMEFARRWGLVRAIEDAGFPRDLPMSIVYTTAVLGPELDRDQRPPKTERRLLPFSPSAHEICPQNFFDPVMQRAARGYAGTTLLYGHRLTHISQHADHVDASVERQGGEPLTIRAQHLVGCDGAGGTTAALLGLEPKDAKVLAFSTNIFFRSEALVQAVAGCRGYRYILMGTEGVWASLVNIDGRSGWRLQVLGDGVFPDFSADEIDALVALGIGADLTYEVTAIMPWARRELVVDRYDAGRCFLAGDSAHQFSPTGGYGMNTGIAEAVDLSWKLAATLDGWGGPELLASYDRERRPVAERNARQASENFAAMRSPLPEPRLLEPGPQGDVIRLEAGARVRQAMAREWNSFGIHLGAVYRDSPIVFGEKPPAVEPDIARFEQSAEPGARAPHFWLEGGGSSLDLFGDGFVLVAFGDDDATALLDGARDRGVPLRVERLQSDAGMALYGRRFVLVRPDGHVAWRADALPIDPLPLLDRVRGAPSLVAEPARTDPMEENVQ